MQLNKEYEYAVGQAPPLAKTRSVSTELLQKNAARLETKRIQQSEAFFCFLMSELFYVLF